MWPNTSSEESGENSQQEPQTDSGLQTPQPDQPIPSEPTAPEQGDDGSDDDGASDEEPETAPDESNDQPQVEDESATEYTPRRIPLENAGLDQHAEEAAKQAELDAEREKHNERTGDASRPRGSH